MMTCEEVTAMIGTEFTYVMGSDTLPAIVTAFDLNIGFTCLATDLVDSAGDDHSQGVDSNGNLCLIALHRSWFNSNEEFMKRVSYHLEMIRDTGKVMCESAEYLPKCPF